MAQRIPFPDSGGSSPEFQGNGFDHIFDHNKVWSTRKWWTQEFQRASFSEQKPPKPPIKSYKKVILDIWVQDAVSSSLATRTISSIHKGFDFMNTRFSFCLSFQLICTEQGLCLALFCYADNGFGRYSTDTPFLVSAL